jgi:hypothetical protein
MNLGDNRQHSVIRPVYPMRYRLRTLLMVLALGPPILAWACLYRDQAISFVIWFCEVWILVWAAHYQETKMLRRGRRDSR